MNKKTYLRAKQEYLVRLAKWLNKVDDAKIDFKDVSHFELAEAIYFHLLYQ